MCSRDYIAAAASQGSIGLRHAIDQQVVPADELFRGATIQDSDERLGRYFRIGTEKEWWWHRRPASGPLADYLAVD